MVIFLRKYFIGALFLVFLTNAASARPYLKIQEVYTGEYPEVRVEVSVSNITPIGDLNGTNFEVYENDWKAGYFQAKKVVPDINPKNLVLLVDASRSLNEDSFNAQIKAVKEFIQGLNKNDKVAVISFEDKVMVRCAFTDSRSQITQCVDQIARRGDKTYLYAAIKSAWNLIVENGEQRNSVILFSDGKEEGSGVSLFDLLAMAKTTRIPTFVVGTGEKNALQDLARISRTTGGEIYHTAQKDNIGKIYMLLSKLLDNTYLIRYKSEKEMSGAGGPTQIEVRFSSETIKDQDKVVYYAPEGLLHRAVLLTGLQERDILVIGGLAIILLILLWTAFTLRKIRRNIVKPEQKKQEERETVVMPFEEAPFREVSHYEERRPENTQKPLPLDYRHAYILEKEGPHTGKKHPIRWYNVTIGHGEENTIVIDDPTVSYRHAKVELKNGQFYLYDLMSERGVYLNGKKLLRPREIHDFDQIELGRTVLMFRKAAG